ncbi:MAG TPA: DNA (cytosine-5-)-methyltransferase, partial [Sphingobacterium sp.]|nr:DNA (cytosine-5-)-methyltransferase [Sphingobacterium sp.]
MTHGSLFSGIGGFDLAAQWMGWQNIFHCEINPFCQKILKYYWPNADSYTDIKQTDFSIYRGKIDVLSGGFPCQPFSTAGKRKGAEDDRYLWPEMLRAIDEIRPTWVIGENVAGLASMVQPEAYKTNVESQINIQGEVDQETVLEYQQYVTETVCSDLEHLGYSVQPIIIPACATGAPHR